MRISGFQRRARNSASTLPSTALAFNAAETVKAIGWVRLLAIFKNRSLLVSQSVAMPASSFFARSVPFEQIDKLAISGGYSSIYAISEPIVPVVGNWEQRFCRLADTFQPVLDRVHDFEVREDDVWIVTLPKCGTTWMQELTWLVLNQCDFETAKSVDLTIRSPFLE